MCALFAPIQFKPQYFTLQICKTEWNFWGTRRSRAHARNTTSEWENPKVNWNFHVIFHFFNLIFSFQQPTDFAAHPISSAPLYFLRSYLRLARGILFRPQLHNDRVGARSSLPLFYIVAARSKTHDNEYVNFFCVPPFLSKVNTMTFALPHQATKPPRHHATTPHYRTKEDGHMQQ